MTYSLITRALIGFFIFLFPLFYLPITTDPYDYNKLALLVLFCLILLALAAIKIFLQPKIKIYLGSFGIPLILLSILSLVSTFIHSPNLTIALTTSLATSTIVAGSILYLLLINLFSDRNYALYMNILIIDCLVLCAYVIALYLGVFSNKAFTPAGNLLSTVMFLSTIAVYLLAKILSSFWQVPTIRRDASRIRNEFTDSGQARVTGFKISSSLLLWNIVSFLLIAATNLFLILNLLTSEKAVILPYKYGWSIWLETFKNIKTLLLGVGPSNFQSIFTLTKSVSFNYTSVWNIIFTSSSSFLLNLATETGILAIFIYLLILFITAKLLYKNFTQNPLSYEERVRVRSEYLPYQISLIFALIIQIFLPSSMSVLILTIVLLAFVSEKNKFLEISLSKFKILAYPASVALIFAVGVVLFFASKFYLAEVYFKRSVDNLIIGNGSDAYNYGTRAITLNKRSDRFRLVFSQTNLALANGLAGKKDLSDDDKQNIPRLVQQAIDQARSAVQLNSTNIVNWDNLARIYGGLINFAQGSDEWAIDAHQKKILLDPNGPNPRFALGTFYYNLDRFSEAEKSLQQAINLKRDFANAHYNLAAVYKQQKKYKESIRELQTTLALIKPGSDDAQKVETEIAELTKLLPTSEATITEEIQPSEQTETLLPVESSPSALENPPSGVPTIYLPEPH